MDSRERTFLALDFEEPDRVPLDFWASGGFKEKLSTALGTSVQTFLDACDIDLRYIEGPRYIGPPPKKFPDGSEEDIWGVHRRTVAVPTGDAVEHYKEVSASPLASAETLEDIDNYDHWPSPDWYDYSMIEEQCEKIRSRKRVAVFMGDRLNRIAQLKPAMYLRGVEAMLTDLHLNPELASAIISRIRSFYCAYAERIFKAAGGKLDILLTGDDFGSQNGPLISPEMWIRFLGQGFSDFTAIAKSHDIRVMHHTCGSVRPIIPLMIERGLDVLQSLQPQAADMDARSLKEEFGGRLAFHGGISIQRTLPFGSPADVRAEVKNVFEALAPGGGYIACTAHNIQADTPVENVKELLKAYEDYGYYS